MAERQPNPGASFTVRADQPLLGVIEQRNGTEVVRYFTDEAEAAEASGQFSVQQALSLLGAWRHLDSEEVLDELDRIRHESCPTPPIDLPELEQ